MGDIYILQGAPGCGKSTFIREHGLGDNVVSPDAIRRMVEPGGPVYDDRTHDVVPGYDFSGRLSHTAFSIAEETVARRMASEDTIIIDSVAASRRTIGGILHQAAVNCYDVHYVDMQSGLGLDEVLRRNAGRGIRAVSEDVVRRKYAACPLYRLEGGEDRITPEDMLSRFDVPEENLDGYDEVRVVGDIQGCFSKLVESGCSAPDSSTKVVFAGDLFDRGPDEDAGPMFDWLSAHHGDANMTFVRGNHDSYLRYYGDSERYKGLPRATRATIDAILGHSGVVSRSGRRLRREARSIYRDMIGVYAFRFHGRSFVVTHGGLHPAILDRARTIGGDGASSYRLGLLSGRDFWYGTGRKLGEGDYSIDIDEIIEADCSEDSPIQIHGHRNEYRHEPDAYEHVFNLETRVEHDGYLSVLRANGSGLRVDRY